MHCVAEYGCVQDERDKSSAPAIVSERIEVALLEILHQKLCAEKCSNARYYRSYKNKLKCRRRLTEQLRYFKCASQENQRRTQQEGEAGSVFIIEAYSQSANHSDAGARKTWNERQRLRQPHNSRFFPCQGRERSKSGLIFDRISVLRFFHRLVCAFVLPRIGWSHSQPEKLRQLLVMRTSA